MGPMVAATYLLHLTAHYGREFHIQNRRVLPHRAVLTSTSFTSMCRFRGEGAPEDGGVGMFKQGHRNDGRGEAFLSRQKLLFLPSASGCLGK